MHRVIFELFLSYIYKHYIAGIGASSLAVYNAYNALNTGKIGKTTLKTISATGTTTITITPPCLVILRWTSITWAELIVASGYKSVLGTTPSNSVLGTGISGTTYSITLNTTAYGTITYGVINL